MPFEDTAPTLAPMTADRRARLGWYRCTGCSARKYCGAGQRCRRCGGEYRRPPAWTTMFSPTDGTGNIEPLELPAKALQR